MDGTDSKENNRLLSVDYSQLMDLRIDFAFKLLFTKGNPRLLISLLNAVFANKKIPRVIKSLTIKNPYLDKESGEDKLSKIVFHDGTELIAEEIEALVTNPTYTARTTMKRFGP